MLLTWTDSIKADIQTAEILMGTAEFVVFFQQCIKIISKTLQHFIYVSTNNFPEEESLEFLFNLSVSVDGKLAAYTIGIQEFETIQQNFINSHICDVPEGSTRSNYLDFCNEFFSFILKRLKQ
ncbi:MAG: hypothetical protein A2161_09990 [Candidatus Schekmanbacteria bacterium RBG_13_48_7]|uniref:Uncharacterized protein n=1 Tax=Candidatus Schekmanbacteria bacterium RBG_13_48_7 TaxID=1817878 RepID=A0A1F7RZG3_9BACT|nr:MAG: hypothetical protein A2161_09990 [Candidatus Schekmanbacteria bacterium RBG_13_48_7]